MKNKWVFMDETGVLANDPQQRFFALGMLKLEQTATLTKEVNRIMQRARSKVTPKFEFKFNSLTLDNKDFYIELVDAFFQFPELYFKAFVLDKQHPKIDVAKSFTSTWDAHIAYSQLLLRHSVDDDEQVAVVADYLDKPKASTKYFESEVMRLERVKKEVAIAPIFNACMLESTASLLIQLVDVLLGLTSYDCKIQSGSLGKNPHPAKLAVLNVLKRHLGVPNLHQTFDVTKPLAFGVWVFDPK